MTSKNTVSSPVAALPSSASTLHGLRIKHTRIHQMMTEMSSLIYPESQDSILLVCGPSGVGKSTLAKHMVTSTLESARAQMQEDAGFIPAVYVEAPSSGESDFSWRLFYERVLAQLDGGLGLPKHHYGVDEATGRVFKPRGSSGNSLGALRTAVERALQERGTRFLVIDEAAHIIRQSRRNRLEIQLDTLKSLSNDCGTQMVLVGSYDLYQLMSLSGQLARRTHVMHFERYRSDVPEDAKAFRACVQKFQDALPTLWGQDIVPHTEALMENTLGCVGTLSAVLTRTAQLAHGEGHWTVDALRRALLTEAQRNKMLEEVIDGELAINPGLTRTLPRQPVGRRPERKAA